MYTYVDSKGPTKIPSRSEVVRLASGKGVLTALVVDANVCLDLAGLSRGNLPPCMRDEVQQFVQDIAASGADVLPGFGLAELCLDRKTWTLDAAKLESLERNISLAIDSAPGRAAERMQDSAAAEIEPVDVEMFRPYVPLLQIFYASLLKVSLIGTQGLSGNRAISNIQAFLRWMSDDLGCVSALPLQAAVAIFGGDSLARRLIGVGRQAHALPAVWGGAWDVFYVHQLYRTTLFQIGGVPHYPVFVTKDRACYEVFSRSRLQGAIRFDERRSPFLIGVASDYPHYEGKQEQVEQLFKTTALSRVQKLVDGERMEQAHLDATIFRLESEWQRLHSEGAT